MNTQEFYEIYKRFKAMSETNLALLKSNLSKECKEKSLEFLINGSAYGARASMLKHLEEVEGITESNYGSFTTVSRNSKITFENFAALCGALDLDLNKVLDPNRKIIVEKGISKKGAKKKWTPEKQKQYIKDYDSNDVQMVADMYELTHDSAEHYYNKFKQELGM